MGLYIAIALWLAALAFSVAEGKRKLPLLSLGAGLATVWLMSNGGQELVGFSILASLAFIALLGSKLGAARSTD